MLPPIRYPLPTLIALFLASLLAWGGMVATRDWRASMADRLRLAVEGPPVPKSSRPAIFAGPSPKRALLLLDQTPATDRPHGSTVETIDRRMFVDVYDTWPEPGPISDVRIGNRKPIGWVPVGDLLLWDTRLVIQAPQGRLPLATTPDGTAESVEVGSLSLPVLAWTEKAAEVAVWDPAQPWSKVARRGWVKLDDLPRTVWGIWISQVELPILLGLANQADSPRIARARAVLGRLADNRSWSPSDVEAVRKALPGVVFEAESDARTAAGRLAEANSQPTSEARWSGLAFRFLGLDDLP